MRQGWFIHVGLQASRNLFSIHPYKLRARVTMVLPSGCSPAFPIAKGHRIVEWLRLGKTSKIT